MPEPIQLNAERTIAYTIQKLRDGKTFRIRIIDELGKTIIERLCTGQDYQLLYEIHRRALEALMA